MQKKNRKLVFKFGIGVAIIFIMLTMFYCIHEHRGNLISGLRRIEGKIQQSDDGAKKTEIQLGDMVVYEQYLTVNEFSRPGTKLEDITGIVIHYTGNPGTTAEGNRSYFQSLAYNQSNYASSHYIVGLEGEIVQCIPLDEQAFATRTRNKDTIGIEVCHPDEDGQFTDVTYESVVKLVAQLCKQFDLSEEDVVRHYDVTGKICPKYYVEHEDAWETLIWDIKTELENIKETEIEIIEGEENEEHTNCG